MFSQLLHKDLIKVDMNATDKWEAVEELIDLLIARRGLRPGDRGEVLHAVFERERSLSTGMEHGLAVPHAAVDCVDSIVAAVGISRRGIPFDSLDGSDARFLVLLVIPRRSFQMHMRALTAIARLAGDRDVREGILNAETADDALQVISAYDLRTA